MPPRGNPTDLAAELAGLGLPPRQVEALRPDLEALPAPAQGAALELARRLGPRAGEALRAAADTLPRLADHSQALDLLRRSDPGQALATLRALPELESALGSKNLALWLRLVQDRAPGEQADLVQRGPGLLASLGGQAAARLGLVLAAALSQERGHSLLADLRLVRHAVQGHRRPRLVLGLAYRLARRSPAAARYFLENLRQGPAAYLRLDQLCRWVLAGLRWERLGSGFFAPRSLAGLAAADELSGGLSLERLFSWLAPYASLHAGRDLKLRARDREPSLPHLDLENPQVLTLPYRLGPEVARPLSVARALASLGARARRLGLHELAPQQVRGLLKELERSAPALQELAPPALFCAGFPAPILAATVLALVVETRIRVELEARLPGLARDFAALDRLRQESPPPWPALEPAERVLGLITLVLAGGGKPAQVLPGDFELAVELAGRIQSQARGRGALELLELAAQVYAGLPPATAAPAQRLPHPAAAGSPSPGGPHQAEPEPGPNTPLSTKNGPSPEGGPQPWNLAAQAEKEPRLAEYHYPEWDPQLGRLAAGRAKVIERPAPDGDARELQAVLAKEAHLAKSLERAFLTLAPSQPAWSGRSADGPELDLDALVAERAEARAGFCPQGLVHRRRQPRLRQVSCGVLWDVSGSTRRNLERRQQGREVVEAAREALALFGRALSAAGDEFALWAYSGVGPQRVDFYPLKDFGETLGGQVLERLAGMKPLAQNRDGAAIRHATRLLASRPSRQRLLIIITDGRPDDYAYGPEVAGRDLALALSAARAAGVRPVAVLLTPEGRRPHQAYGQVPHLILRELEGLARWLPRLYRRLTT